MIRKRQPLFEDVEDILVNVNWVDSHDPEQSIRVGELQYQLNVAIESLPTRCRQIFKMSRINELTYQEISDVLGISEKTVENHLVKALNIIRDSIKRFERYEASCLNKRVTIL
jgi:RNA polymerase sigma-70 factor (ECF subfamily)